MQLVFLRKKWTGNCAKPRCNAAALSAGKIPVNLTGQMMILRDFAQVHARDMESL